MMGPTPFWLVDPSSRQNGLHFLHNHMVIYTFTRFSPQSVLYCNKSGKKKEIPSLHQISKNHLSCEDSNQEKPNKTGNFPPEPR